MHGFFGGVYIVVETSKWFYMVILKKYIYDQWFISFQTVLSVLDLLNISEFNFGIRGIILRNWIYFPKWKFIQVTFHN